MLSLRPDLEVLANAEEIFASSGRQTDVLVERVAGVDGFLVRSAQLGHLNLRPAPAVVTLDRMSRLANHVQHLLPIVHKRVLKVVHVHSVVRHRAGGADRQVLHQERRPHAAHGHHADALRVLLRARQSLFMTYPDQRAQGKGAKCASREHLAHLDPVGFCSRECRVFVRRDEASRAPRGNLAVSPQKKSHSPASNDDEGNGEGFRAEWAMAGSCFGAPLLEGEHRRVLPILLHSIIFIHCTTMKMKLGILYDACGPT
eukprot:scaffold475_cov279-Pinguiococcus_pyrenoidosus.AAC.8